MSPYSATLPMPNPAPTRTPRAAEYEVIARITQRLSAASARRRDQLSRPDRRPGRERTACGHAGRRCGRATATDCPRPCGPSCSTCIASPPNTAARCGRQGLARRADRDQHRRPARPAGRGGSGMSGLVLKLGPHERVLINGAVIENGDKRSKLAIMTPNANILRLRDAIHPEEANTPVRRVCYIAQLVLSGDADPAERGCSLLRGIEQLSQALTDPRQPRLAGPGQHGGDGGAALSGAEGAAGPFATGRTASGRAAGHELPAGHPFRRAMPAGRS
jgi:flagellar protein FlbT